jgi:hypothetical protein
MTVLEWLKSSTRYAFTEDNFIKIALDRGCDPDADVYDETLVTKRDRELMIADIIFTAVLLSPSNTSSLSQSHNGYSKTIGSEQDFYQDEKIKYAIRIYRIYDDERGDVLEDAVRKKIKFIPIVDVVTLNNPIDDKG